VLVREMKRPGFNLSVLFEEYQAVYPDGYAYSRFCQLYRAFERRLSPTMRQTHVAGDKAGTCMGLSVSSGFHHART